MKARPRALPPIEPPPICRKKAPSGWKWRGIEFADQRLALLAAILRDGFDHIVAQVLHRSEVADLARPQLLRQRKLGARHQPMREVIALGVIDQALFRDGAQQVLQLVQVGGARQLP